MEIQFVDESEYQNEGKWYFYIENSQLELCADVSGNIFPFSSKTKNNFRGIDMSQPTPFMSLSVPLFSLATCNSRLGRSARTSISLRICPFCMVRSGDL